MKKKVKATNVDINFSLISYANDYGVMPLLDQHAAGGQSTVTVVIGLNDQGRAELSVKSLMGCV